MQYILPHDRSQPRELFTSSLRATRLPSRPFSVPSTNNVLGYLIVRGEALSKSQVSYGQCSSRTWPRFDNPHFVSFQLHCLQRSRGGQKLSTAQAPLDWLIGGLMTEPRHFLATQATILLLHFGARSLWPNLTKWTKNTQVVHASISAGCMVILDVPCTFVVAYSRLWLISFRVEYLQFELSH